MFQTQNQLTMSLHEREAELFRYFTNGDIYNAAVLSPIWQSLNCIATLQVTGSTLCGFV